MFNTKVQCSPHLLCLVCKITIAADNHDSMFIWNGLNSSLSEQMQRKCKELLLMRSKKRFPAPKLHIFSEDKSMERRLVTRLLPLHDDNEIDQLETYPEFAELSVETQEAVREKFPLYYPSSDKSFKHWFGSIVEAISPPSELSL